MATSLSLESPLSRVPLARRIARSSGDEVKGAAARRSAPRRQPTSAPVIIFTARAECQLVLFVGDRAITFVSHCTRVTWIKVLVYAAEAMFHQRREAHEPCM